MQPKSDFKLHIDRAVKRKIRKFKKSSEKPNKKQIRKFRKNLKREAYDGLADIGEYVKNKSQNELKELTDFVDQWLNSDLMKLFNELQDTRTPGGNKKYPAVELLFIAIFAMLLGHNSFLAMERFGRRNEAFLKLFLKLEHGIPSHDTFWRFFSRILDPEDFGESFINQMRGIVANSPEKHVCVDGKALRGTKGTYLNIVNAYIADSKATIGLLKSIGKRNEIKSTEALLEMINITGAIITTDAMGTQRNITGIITEKGGRYVLPVSGNQKNLRKGIKKFFRKNSPLKSTKCTREDNKHGRKETREYKLIVLTEELRQVLDPENKWSNLKSVLMVTASRKRGKKKTTKRIRYYVSSSTKGVRELSRMIRGHWGVENNLHYTLDIFFGEDDYITWNEQASVNLAIMRRYVVTLIENYNRVQGIKSVKEGKELCASSLIEASRVLFTPLP
jgi:predicted transposase YbfD/YdcC